jgi:GT2 family glycosyltransferase
MSLSVSIVILSFNRRDALRMTLGKLGEQGWTRSDGPRSAEVIVVDNGSSDGSAAMVREEFAGVRLIALATNTMLEGFNIGAAAAKGDVLVILDDDSWPEPGAVEGAVGFLESEPKVAGIMLHRRHPRTLAYEWPFDQPSIKGVQRGWPDMGCGNVIRREAWERVRGYETGYTLYRNDTDMALKLLGAGYDVVFNPEWLVWHDSHVITKRSNRWLRLSTRNWIWLARRHSRGMVRYKGQLLGWLHAHRLAGASVTGQLCVLRGMLEGLFAAAPRIPECVNVADGGTHYRRLITLKMELRS